MTREAEAVALGLTKAQARAVRALDGQAFTDWAKVYRQRRQRISAHAMGLTEPERIGPVTMWCSIRLTPLGIEVRRILQERKP